MAKNSDRISALPRDIRNHIISFLSMEDAMRTTILSHQFRDVAFSLPNLEFDIRTFTLKFQKFLQKEPEFISRIDPRLYLIDYVDRLLLGRDSSSCLKKVSLTIVDGDLMVLTSGKINEWIDSAIKHNAEELQLHIVSRAIHLVKLSDVVSYYPMLKRITLSGILFHDVQLVEKFFSNCTRLENLSIVDCYTSFPRLTISGTKLRTLRMIIECNGDSKEIKICAPNLRQLEYRCNVPPTITSETIASVVSVNILLNADFSYEVSRKVFDHHARNIWMGLNSVTTLCLHHHLYIEFLARAPDLSVYRPTACVSLKHLELVIRPTNDHIQVLTFLLRAYPNLQTLKIYVVEGQATFMPLRTMERDQPSQELSNGDELKQLKTVVIYSFQGHDSEIDLVKYLLGNAIILEKLVFNGLHRSLSRKQLLKFNRVSPHAVVSFS